jgi:hypothetical protein
VTPLQAIAFGLSLGLGAGMALAVVGLDWLDRRRRAAGGRLIHFCACGHATRLDHLDFEIARLRESFRQSKATPPGTALLRSLVNERRKLRKQVGTQPSFEELAGLRSQTVISKGAAK